MDDEKHDKYMKDMYHYEERTEHKGILPAKERIKQYKIQKIKKPWPVPKSGVTRMHGGTQSQTDLKKDMGQKFDQRPTTAGLLSVLGHSEANTAVTGG